jgi:hypothetical protein
MYVCISVDVLRASAWMVRHILFIFGSEELSVIGRCPVSMNILDSEIGALEIPPKKCRFS